MKIRFVDLIRQNSELKSKIYPALENIIENATFIMGKPLKEFEENFANYCGKKYAIGLNSGTDALKLALVAYGIGPGDEVITVPNSYFSTAMVISTAGANPVFVDINSDTYLIDVNQIEKAITKKTKAIIPVHLYGQAADMTPILKLAKKYHLIVIEDCCQAHGAIYKGNKVPIGETGAFSFYPGKNLGSFGDGGALVTDNKKIFGKISFFRNDGSVKKYFHKTLGTKSRLDTLQAAILNIKIAHLDKWNKKRYYHAKLYRKLLKNIKEVKLPKEMDYGIPAYHLFVISVPNRDKLKKYLEKQGIETVIHYPIPIHLQEAYKLSGFKKGDFPNTEKSSQTILSLPMFPELTNSEIKYITSCIDNSYKSNSDAIK